MEKPEIVWNYKLVQIQEDFTSEYYRYEYPIYIVSRDKNEHWEIIRAIYQYMRKLYQEKYPYYRKQIRTILYHSEPPFNLIVEFEREMVVIWSSDPAVQEHSRQLFTNWQQLENYYNDLLEYCQHRKESIARATQLIKEYQDAGKPIDYCPPNIRWTQYKSGLRITENYTTNKGKSFDNQIFIRENTALEIGYQMIFDEILNYIISKKQDSELYNRNGHRQIQFAFDYLRKNCKMVVQIATKNFWDESRTWKNDIVLWSMDQAEQEATKQRFICWKAIEHYYNEYYKRWKSYCSFDTIEDFIKEREIKTERRIKREQNDPTNPAARKRKARRHLQRLGYALHISRKVVFNGKKYQVVELDSGKIVAGENYDLTLDQVEEFYRKKDIENADS